MKHGRGGNLPDRLALGVCFQFVGCSACGRLLIDPVEFGFRFGLLLKTKGRIGFVSFLTLGSSKARPPVSGDATKAVFFDFV
jgi:hypothetical protein